MYRRVPLLFLSFGLIRLDFCVPVTLACARRPGAAASMFRRRRERRTLLAGGGRRASRSHTLAASQAFERMHTLLCRWVNLRVPIALYGLCHVLVFEGLACRERVAAAASLPTQHACDCTGPSRARFCHRNSKLCRTW